MAFENLEMGPCEVTFDSVDLGLTKGGVEVEFATEVAPVTADQFGDTIIDEYVKGRAVKVKVPMAERDLTKFAAVFPGATLVGTATKKLVFNSAVGTSLRTLAAPLTLHPKAMGVSAAADVNIPLAMCKGDFSFAFKHDEQRVYMVEFTGFVDLDTEELFSLGDPAAA